MPFIVNREHRSAAKWLSLGASGQGAECTLRHIEFKVPMGDPSEDSV